MFFGVPFMCIKTVGTPIFAINGAIAGSNLSALISLTIVAPASIACLATSLLYVSMLMGISVSLERAVTMGITLFSSSLINYYMQSQWFLLLINHIDL